jgi:hypothetical protein
VTAKHRPRQLGEMLVERGLLTQEQLDSALRDHRSMPKSLGRSLIDLGYIKERDLVSALAEQAGLDFVDLSEYQIDPVVAALLPDQLARRYRAIPIGESDGKLLVAMPDPANLYALDDIRTVTDREIQPVVALASDVEHALDTLAASSMGDLGSAPYQSERAALDAVRPDVDEPVEPGAARPDVDEPVVPSRLGPDVDGAVVPGALKPNAGEQAASRGIRPEVPERIPVVHAAAVPLGMTSQMATNAPLEELVARLVSVSWLLVGASIALIVATIVLAIVLAST